MRDQCLNKYQNILNLSNKNFSVVSKKGLVSTLSLTLSSVTKMEDLYQDLLLAKLNAYGLSLPALTLFRMGGGPKRPPLPVFPL